MRRLWTAVLVCACTPLALVGAAAPHASDQTWEWGSGQNFVRVVRESATGPVTSIEIDAQARCDGGPAGDFTFDRAPGAAGARVISVSLTGWGIRYS